MIARVIRSGVLALASLALLAGCTTAVGGTGTAVRAPEATTAAASSSPPPAPAATISATALLGLVVPVPAGATASTDPWAANSTPTIDQFATVQFAPDAAVGAAAALEAAGVAAIAHRAWYVPGGASADDLLLQFGTAAQAQAWLGQLVATSRATPGYTAVPAIAGMPGFTAPTRNQDGDAVTIFYGAVGAIGVIVDYWTPGAYRPGDAQAWLPAQLARLR